VESDAYCREIEAHLCRVNAGHLVRVVGPAFEMVAGWASQGIPLKVVVRGIDRTVERRAGKAAGRRPLRVEFCEADVLDAFDEWRRAVGVGTAGAGAAVAGETAADDAHDHRQGSLRAHLDRVAVRLTACLSSGTLPPGLERAVEGLLDELSPARDASRTLRGEARTALIARLRGLDDRLIESARREAPPDLIAVLAGEAEQELAAFRGRMAAPDHARAIEAATLNLLRARFHLPLVTYE
jgi:hypothetical protein